MPGPYRDIYNKKEIIYGHLPANSARLCAARRTRWTPFTRSARARSTTTLKQGIADCIAARELIKVKVLENSEYSAREAADILCEALDCECVQVIGRKFVLFKQKKKESAYTAVLAK